MFVCFSVFSISLMMSIQIVICKWIVLLVYRRHSSSGTCNQQHHTRTQTSYIVVLRLCSSLFHSFAFDTSFILSNNRLLYTNKINEMPNRHESAAIVDASILGESITFPCGITTRNRIMKTAMSERLASWDDADRLKRGIPSQQLINAYEKFAVGGFGCLVTGNTIVNPVSRSIIDYSKYIYLGWHWICR